MAIRLRHLDGGVVALCAAETDEAPDDVYLDDATHYAIAAKFALDWHGQTVDWSYPLEWGLMETQKLRDAQVEHDNWESAGRPSPIDGAG